MGVSQVKLFTLSTGQGAVVSNGPAILTSLMIAELSGAAPAIVDVTGKTYATAYMQVVVPAGRTVVWNGEPLAFGSGIGLADQSGDAAVSVGWR